MENLNNLLTALVVVAAIVALPVTAYYSWCTAKSNESMLYYTKVIHDDLKKACKDLDAIRQQTKPKT